MKKKNSYELKHYRKLLHLLSGIIAIFYYFFSYKEEIFIYIIWLIVCSILMLDAIRLLFSKINDFIYKYLNHLFIDREKNRINSASYYFCGILFCIYFLPVEIAVSSMLFLSFGDTFASFIGIHFGKHKISKKKTFEGSLACFLICFLLAILFLPFHISLIGAIIATLSELIPWSLDDNLTIPIFSGISMTLIY